MRHPHSWFGLHIGGWYAWLPGTILFCAVLYLARRNPAVRKVVPWFALGLWLAMTLAGYFGENWGQYSYNRALWAGGVANMLAVTFIPLCVSYLIEMLIIRLKGSPLVASVSAAVGGVVVVFLANFAVGIRVQYWVMTWLRHG